MSPEFYDTSVREELKPHVGRRIVVEGRLCKFGDYFDVSVHRRVPSALFKDIDIMEGPDHDKRFALCPHMWIQFAAGLREKNVEPGDVVRMTCLVYKYRSKDAEDHNKVTTKYAMRDPVDIEIVRRCSDGFEDKIKSIKNSLNLVTSTAPMLQPPAPEPEPQPVSPPRAATGGARECFSVIAEAVDVYGIAKVEKALAAVRMILE